MKKIFFHTLFLFMSLFFAIHANATADYGKKAPLFEGTDAHGKKVSLARFHGKYVVLEWLNHGCPFVKKHYNSGNMQRLQKKYTKRGVVWLSIVSSKQGKQGYMSPQKTLQVAKEKKSKASHILLDPQGVIGRLYGAKTTPHMFVISPKGMVLFNGAIDNKRGWDPQEIKKAKNYVSKVLEAGLSGKPVIPFSSQPYGCSVKY